MDAESRSSPVPSWRIRLHADTESPKEFSMDGVVDLDSGGSPVGVELISPGAAAAQHSIQFDGDATALNALERTSYDADSDAMYVYFGSGHSIDQRNALVTLVVTKSGRVVELIVH